MERLLTGVPSKNPVLLVIAEPTWPRILAHLLLDVPPEDVHPCLSGADQLRLTEVLLEPLRNG